jgi:sec-independent protein translocase protein TatA
MPFAHGVGVPELVIILVIVMIIFGVGRLPEIGGALGKAIREFRSSQSGEPKAKESPELEAAKARSEK